MGVDLFSFSCTPFFVALRAREQRESVFAKSSAEMILNELSLTTLPLLVISTVASVVLRRVPPLHLGRFDLLPVVTERKVSLRRREISKRNNTPLLLPRQSILSSHSQHTSNQLDSPRTIIIGGNGVGDATRVDVGIANADGRDLVGCRLAEGMLIKGRGEEDEEGRLERLGSSFRRPRIRLDRRGRDLTPPKHLLGIGDGPRQPFRHSKPILPQPLSILPNSPLRSLQRANKNDNASPFDYTTDDLSCSTEGGESLTKVDVGEVGARAVDVGEGGAVGEGRRVAEVSARGDEVRGG